LSGSGDIGRANFQFNVLYRLENKSRAMKNILEL
jgi:hypothetical protein